MPVKKDSVGNTGTRRLGRSERGRGRAWGEGERGAEFSGGVWWGQGGLVLVSRRNVSQVELGEQ